MSLLDSLISGPIGAKIMELISGHPDGAAGVVARFREQDMGHIVDSWMGPGEKLPITGDQVQAVLGQDNLDAIAGKIGVPSSLVGSVIAKYLPDVISHCMSKNSSSAGTSQVQS